jgi:hypothetical protein
MQQHAAAARWCRASTKLDATGSALIAWRGWAARSLAAGRSLHARAHPTHARALAAESCPLTGAVRIRSARPACGLATVVASRPCVRLVVLSGGCSLIRGPSDIAGEHHRGLRIQGINQKLPTRTLSKRLRSDIE